MYMYMNKYMCLCGRRVADSFMSTSEDLGPGSKGDCCLSVEHPYTRQHTYIQGKVWYSRDVAVSKNIFIRNEWSFLISSQFSSVAQSCLTLCNPMDCSTPGFPVHHQLTELAQAHVHRVSDTIQPSHPLLSPSPPTFNLSQHQGLF